MGKKLLGSNAAFFYFLFVLIPTLAAGQCVVPGGNATVSITQTDGSSNICSDETISFSSAIDTDGGSTDYTLQWQVKLNNGSWSNISSETSASLTNYNPAVGNNRIRLEVTFCNGTVLTSSQSSLITVNERKTGTVTISASKTTICPGENIDFTASPTNAGSSATYEWKVNGTTEGNSSSFSSSSIPDGASVQLFITSSLPCVDPFSSNVITIDHKPAAPDMPGNIAGDSQVCANTSGITYSITSVDRATSYQWTLPSGWSGSSTSESITVTSGSVANNQIIKVKAINSCGESAEQTLSVNVGPGKPSTPSAISDPGIICPGSSITLGVTNDPSINSYTWEVPSGWNISAGQGTNEITVTAGNYGQNGTVSVYSTNDCLDSDTSSQNFTINEPEPATPGTISGKDIVCPNTDITYSISAVQYADEYIWYFDGSEVSGQNGTSITINSGNSGSKDIKVIAVNECSDSDYLTITASTKTITVDDGTPDATSISQQNGEQNFCPGETGIIFSVPSDSKIDTYDWQLPSGWSVTAGTGTNQITVTAGQLGNDGQINFTGSSNDCGSVTATYDVYIKDPAPVITSESISGETNVCHSTTGLTYSIPAIQYATNYIWNLPGNWSIASGDGTNSITVNAGTDDGNITVYAENDCGQSTPISLAVVSEDAVPPQPGQITGQFNDGSTIINICPVINGLNFQVAPVSGAESYNWHLPSGWVITNGEGTENITVNVPSNSNYPNSVFVQVGAVNKCGESSSLATYYTDINNTEGINIGNYVEVDAGPDQTVCESTSPITISGNIDFNGSKLKIQPSIVNGSGTISDVPNGKVDSFTFTYTPSSTDIQNGQDVVIRVAPQTAPSGSCSGEFYDEMKIIFRAPPEVSISGDATICEGNSSTITFTGSPNTQVTYTINGGTNQTITLDSSGAASLDSGSLTSTTTYSLVSAIYTEDPTCSASISGSATITVTPTPTAEISYADGCTSETSLAVTLTGTNNYSGGIFSGPSGLSIDPDAGTINPSASTPGNYTVTYTIPASGGCEEVPVTTEVTILEQVAISQQPAASRLCEGSDAHFEVSATGDGLTYQWYKDAATSGNEISGATSATLDIFNISASDAGDYLVTVSGTSPCAPVTSDAATLSVDENIIVETQPESQTICEGNTVTLSLSATSGGAALTSDYSYQWYKGTPGAGTAVNGATSENFTLNSATPSDDGDYYAEISGPSEFQCEPTLSEAATITVRPTPTAEIFGDASICSGTSSDITFTNGIPNGIITYIVNNDNNNPKTFTLDASGEGTLNTGNLTATDGNGDGKPDNTDFIYEIQSVAYSDAPECKADVSGTATITVAPVPIVNIAFDGDQTEFCTADGTTYTPALTGEGTFTGGTFSANGGLNLDPSTGAFVPSGQNAGDYTITYTYPAAGGCSEGTATLDISIYEEVKITSQPYNVGICSTQDAEFSITATGDDLSYQWYKDGSPLSGKTSPTLSLPVATSENAGEYYVIVSGTNACTPNEDSAVESDHAFLSVDEDIVILEPAEDVKVCATGNEDVQYRFVVHANGAPLKFEWIYANGNPVAVDGNDPSGRYTTTLTADPAYEDYDFTVYIGTLSIENVTDADEGAYAVRIDGSENNFHCSEAVSNSFKLEVDPLPDPPVVADVEYCTGETPTALTAPGDNLQWYDETMNPLDNAPVPVTDVATDFTYYVTQTPLYCESNPAQITVHVNARPAKPTVAQTEINYCLGETATALEATADGADSSLNWYNSATSTDPVSEAPIPQTSSKGDISYWVSQTNANGCEGEREKITVHIHDLPNITPLEDQTICEGTEVTLTANDENVSDDSTSFTWEDGDGNTLTGSSITITPSATVSYTITGTNSNGCTNTEEVTITVDPLPVGGTLEGPASVCENNTGGSITLSGQEGTIDRWEYMDSTTSDWTALPNSGGVSTYDFSSLNLTEATTFRAVLTSGVCSEVYSTEHTVEVDPVPVGGVLKFDDNDDRIFMICENPESGYASDLTLQGYEGEVISWEYRNGTSGWMPISGETGITLSASKIEDLINNQSTAFRVEIGSGACTPNKFSETAIISVIPSDIEPSPVQVTPRIVCKGELVTLSSSTGYGENFGKFDGGAFDNSSIVNKGWRITDDKGNSDYNFSSDADNIRPEKWLRTTPHDYITADLQSPYTVGLDWWESKTDPAGNKGFAIVSGKHPSTLETPVFNLTGLDEAVLTFDQAYNLVNGASIAVQISTDGGNTYTTLYSVTAEDSPATGKTSGNYDHFGEGTPDVNQMEIDLGNYLYQTNLRIRFKYDGENDGDIWTLDNIQVPEGPRDISLEWRDYSDPATYPDGEYIGSNTSEQWEPKLIGWNNFQVKTKIILDSNGNSCASVENSKNIRVFVFDHYETTVDAEAGSCGSYKVSLNANAIGDFSGNVSSYPTADGYIGEWYIELNGSEADPSTYTLTNADASSTLEPTNNPDVVFEAQDPGDFSFSWHLVSTEVYPDDYFDETLRGLVVENDNCPSGYTSQNVTLQDCTTLDFDGVDDYVDLGTNYTGSSYSIEAWIRPFNRPLPDGSGNTVASTGTIISGPGFEIKMQDLPSSITPGTRWYHIAYTSSGKLYIDGIPQSSNSISGVGETKTLIGARWNAATGAPENYFSGWIEEVRLWKKDLTQDQIRFMMNQHLQNSGNMGVEIPMPVPGGLSYSDLDGYYRLISSNPDPNNLLSYDASLMPSNGETPDLATSKVPGILNNMTTDQQNTAPLPYISANDGKWTEINTWLRPEVWDIPNSSGINGDPIEWNIVKTYNNISSDAKDITVLGLKLEEPGTLLTIADPGSSMDENNTGQFIRVTHYLLLDGNIDLVGESQLLQDEGSILEEASGGWLERDQQGTQSSFNYNYWSSPVSLQGQPNNSGYSIKAVLGNPRGNITYGTSPFAADGTPKNPNDIIISNYWLWTYLADVADVYAQWDYLGENGSIGTGQGFTMKGSSGAAAISDRQDYVFRGKPHNGDIKLHIGSDQNFLIGNPYPSALDADQFIIDNLEGSSTDGNYVFNGAIYFWDHFAGATHYLERYIGGYAIYNLAGAAPAVSIDERINNNNATGSKLPQRYIPVAQGFFLSTAIDEPTDTITSPISIPGGDFFFKNSQRVYARESKGESLFLKPEQRQKGQNKVAQKDEREKIRLKFHSPTGYHRQILVTKDEHTTGEFDFGYDAPLIEYNDEDMYWLINSRRVIIQGVPDFNEDRVLPLGIQVAEGGYFKIQIDSLENFPADKPVYLKDKLLDSIHDLREAAYDGTARIGISHDRFEIVFSKEEKVTPPDPDSELESVDVHYNHRNREIEISNPELIEISKVMVFDLTGKKITEFDEIPTSKEFTLPMTQVRTSIYIVKVITIKGNGNKKFIMR